MAILVLLTHDNQRQVIHLKKILVSLSEDGLSDFNKNLYYKTIRYRVDGETIFRVFSHLNFFIYFFKLVFSYFECLQSTFDDYLKNKQIII